MATLQKEVECLTKAVEESIKEFENTLRFWFEEIYPAESNYFEIEEVKIRKGGNVLIIEIKPSNKQVEISKVEKLRPFFRRLLNYYFEKNRKLKGCKMGAYLKTSKSYITKDYKIIFEYNLHGFFD